MSRRLLIGSLWGFTTAVATTVCWAGVSVVTASITAAHSPAIPAKAVHAALTIPRSYPAAPSGSGATTSTTVHHSSGEIGRAHV